MFNITELLEWPFKKGTVIKGRYQVINFIGKGSYGMVYRSLDLKSNKTVLIKQLRNRKKRNRKELLIRETQLLQALNHPAIPQCIDFFQEKKKFFLIMEYINGKNFEDLILHEGQKYDHRESLKILLEVLYVVKYLHEQGIIHRDLRLPNILLKDNQVCVIDFGLAVYENSEQSVSTKSTSLEKELFREMSFKSDFYALGHFLLFLLYSDYEATSKRELSWEEELNLKEDTKKVIRKMLRIESCYEDVDELITDVENVLDSLKEVTV
jgi:serine/threonine protein kinase, bacterial